MPIHIHPVRGRRDLSRFIDYAYVRNRRDPHWIPPLRIAERERLSPKKNPFFGHAEVELLMAWRDGRPIGRIAAIEDHLHNEVHKDNVAMFGFFDAEDLATARALLERVETWARQRGRTSVRGPLNPSLNESAGLLIDGHDTDSMLMMPRNPPEYAAFIEGAGYEKVKDLYAWIYDIGRELDAGIRRIAARVQRETHITVRPFDLKEFATETERLRE